MWKIQFNTNKFIRLQNPAILQLRDLEEIPSIKAFIVLFVICFYGEKKIAIGYLLQYNIEKWFVKLIVIRSTNTTKLKEEEPWVIECPLFLVNKLVEFTNIQRCVSMYFHHNFPSFYCFRFELNSFPYFNYLSFPVFTRSLTFHLARLLQPSS